MFEAERLVFFTGAGISTESGLPDFRGSDGVWTRQEKGPPPRPVDLDWSSVEPNEAHRAIVELQKMGKLTFLISQNVDNLHLKSGIRPELLAELHGNIALLRCGGCEKTYPKATGTGRCGCGGRLTSSVVNFGDSLPFKDLTESYDHSQNCDLFVVVGSSLVVTPAADMPRVALDAGAQIVIINQGETPFDRVAHLRFDERAGEVLPKAVEKLKERLDRGRHCESDRR
jgi:NAD-dependent SIR2 family protein deacetylase